MNSLNLFKALNAHVPAPNNPELLLEYIRDEWDHCRTFKIIPPNIEVNTLACLMARNSTIRRILIVREVDRDYFMSLCNQAKYRAQEILTVGVLEKSLLQELVNTPVKIPVPVNPFNI